jgi:hypothetical protein
MEPGDPEKNGILIDFWKGEYTRKFSIGTPTGEGLSAQSKRPLTTKQGGIQTSTPGRFGAASRVGGGVAGTKRLRSKRSDDDTSSEEQDAPTAPPDVAPVSSTPKTLGGIRFNLQSINQRPQLPRKN